MSGKAVASSGNTGPRDFSAEVGGHFAAPAQVPAITARIFLPGDDAGKVSAADVSAALAELLVRLGVEPRVSVDGPSDHTADLGGHPGQIARTLAEPQP